MELSMSLCSGLSNGTFNIASVDAFDVLASNLSRLSDGEVSNKVCKLIFKDAFNKFKLGFNPEDLMYFNENLSWTDDCTKALEDGLLSDDKKELIDMYQFFRSADMDCFGYILVNLISCYNGWGIVSFSFCSNYKCDCDSCIISTKGSCIELNGFMNATLGWGTEEVKGLL